MKFNIKTLFTIFLTLSITITIFNTFISNALDNNNEVYIKQLELKNKLFIDAIDNFGATSPQEAVILYCEKELNQEVALFNIQLCVMN